MNSLDHPCMQAPEGGDAPDEEWDARFTDLAITETPPNCPEGDPVKVNEYRMLKSLGAGQ
jgi:hypothetical protein